MDTYQEVGTADPPSYHVTTSIMKLIVQAMIVHQQRSDEDRLFYKQFLAR